MTRLKNLYLRYAALHRRIDWPGGPLPCGGYLDRIAQENGRLVVEGWTPAGSAALCCGDQRVAGPANLARPDVAEATGFSEHVGFRLEIAPPFDDPRLETGHGNSVSQSAVSKPARARRIQAEATVLLRFARDLARALPHLPRAVLAGDAFARQRVKSCLGLVPQPASSALEHRMFDCAGLPPGPDGLPVTIVLPVYNAFDLLKETLDRVERHTDLPWHLVVIEDASPDRRVLPFLRHWANTRATQVTLLENETNLGFIGSVNRGFEVALKRGTHVVLLNSDALVPPGWARRLLRPIQTHANVASVTPMSNDATILSVPAICEPGQVPAAAALAADRLAQQFNPEAGLTELPTGVGFCMAINIAYLRREPQLDPVFGRGYGEEVDWCQRVRRIGGRHLGLPGLFVEHRGGESFGSDARERLIRRNNRIVSARYPAFDAEVQRFVLADPMATPRLLLGFAIAAEAAPGPLSVYVAHSMGGGADAYLRQRIATDLATLGAAVVVRVGGTRRWRLELHGPKGVTAGDTDDFGFVRRAIEVLGPKTLVYSCAVGDRDPAGLPEALRALLAPRQRDRLQVLFHDYFPISPSYTLLDSDGVYRGPPRLGSADPAHRVIRPDGRVVDLAGWRAAWAGLMHAADDAVVFSQDSREIVLSVYPALRPKLRVRPHSLLCPIRPVRRTPAAPEVVGVLGNIGPQKGAGVLQSLAAKLPPVGAPRLVLIGNIDPVFALPGHVAVAGSYDPQDIPHLAEAHGITSWLIPSIWPETFSYTTHEALATGLPVRAFHIGAQGEAVAKAANGIALNFDPSVDLADVVLSSFAAPDLARAA